MTSPAAEKLADWGVLVIDSVGSAPGGIVSDVGSDVTVPFVPLAVFVTLPNSRSRTTIV